MQFQKQETVPLTASISLKSKQKQNRNVRRAQFYLNDWKEKNSYLNMSAGVSVYSVSLPLGVMISSLGIIQQQWYYIVISLFHWISLKRTFVLTLKGRVSLDELHLSNGYEHSVCCSSIIMQPLLIKHHYFLIWYHCTDYQLSSNMQTQMFFLSKTLKCMARMTSIVNVGINRVT